MKQLESEHYVFHYATGSTAERDIARIAACQEACLSHMCGVLNVRLPFKLQYFLCDTAEEVGRLYKGEPCNGLAVYPDKIYAVYSESARCIGFHEDAHLISFLFYDPNPDSPAVEEGFAMYFDRKWWGIHNLDWTGYFIKCGMYIPIEQLLDADAFYAKDCSITYPIMGAFTEWLIATGGLERYLLFFRKRDQSQVLSEVYGKTVQQMNDAFVAYVDLFAADDALEKRMAQLLKEYVNP